MIIMALTGALAPSERCKPCSLTVLRSLAFRKFRLISRNLWLNWNLEEIGSQNVIKYLAFIKAIEILMICLSLIWKVSEFFCETWLRNYFLTITDANTDSEYRLIGSQQMHWYFMVCKNDISVLISYNTFGFVELFLCEKYFLPKKRIEKSLAFDITRLKTITTLGFAKRFFVSNWKQPKPKAVPHRPSAERRHRAAVGSVGTSTHHQSVITFSLLSNTITQTIWAFFQS